MAKLDPYTNMRGGALMHVSGKMASTIASWGLNLGRKAGGGHPRYTAADALAVVMMQELTDHSKIAAGRSAAIVNFLYPTLGQLIERAMEEARSARAWNSKMMGPYALIGSNREQDPDGPFLITMADEDELVDLIKQARQGSMVVLPIGKHILRTIVMLSNYLEVENNLAKAEAAA